MNGPPQEQKTPAKKGLPTRRRGLSFLGQITDRIAQVERSLPEALVSRDQGPVLQLVGRREVQGIQRAERHPRMHADQDPLGPPDDRLGHGRQIDQTLPSLLLETPPSLGAQRGADVSGAFAGRAMELPASPPMLRGQPLP